MRVFTIDCDKLPNEAELWERYVETTNPDGAGYFGRNLDAFWDALNGGPGYPGECELQFVNTKQLQMWREGRFYEALKKIGRDSVFISVRIE